MGLGGTWSPAAGEQAEEEGIHIQKKKKKLRQAHRETHTHTQRRASTLISAIQVLLWCYVVAVVGTRGTRHYSRSCHTTPEYYIYNNSTVDRTTAGLSL